MADEQTLDLILRKARSHSDFTEKPVDEAVLRAAHLRFWQHLPRMFHNPEAINWFKDKGAHTETTAFRNGTLQGAYYLLALRAVGLDCGAMSGFDNAKVDAAFFPDGQWKSNFLVNIGYGTGKGLPPRNPRLTFEETCRIL